MRFDLVIAVWGPWHLDALNRAMFPSLLAPGNISALSAPHECRIRLFTTETSAARLKALPVFHRVSERTEVELKVGGAGDSVSSDFHIAWWQQAVEEARTDGAIVVSAHPDVMWSRNSFATMVKEFEAGRKAVVVPNIRVVADTFLPAVEALTKDCVLDIGGRDAAALALRHLHPLSAAELAGQADNVTATTMQWPVQGQGLVLRHASRPAIAADPRRCSLDMEFYVRDVSDRNEVYNLTDVSEMLMLSIAPMYKDAGLLEFETSMTPLHLARWCAHPQNDTPLAAAYGRDPLLLPIDPAASAHLVRGSAIGDDFMARVERLMPATKIFHALMAAGCKRSAELLALALHETDPMDWPPLTGAATVLALDDSAFAQLGDEPTTLVQPGREGELVRFIARFVLAGRIDLAKSGAAQTLAGTSVMVEAKSGATLIDGRAVRQSLEPLPGVTLLKIGQGGS